MIDLTQSIPARSSGLGYSRNAMTTTHFLRSAPIDRAASVKVLRIAELLRQIRRGQIRLPPVSAGMGMPREDALSLFDSLWRGFPIGAVTLWERAECDTAPNFQLGYPLVHRDERIAWVVDGQAPVAVLADALLDQSGSDGNGSIRFDLDEDRFVDALPGDHRDEPGRWLPVAELADQERLARWTKTFLPEASPRKRRAAELFIRIRDYELPVQVVHARDEAEVLEILGRLAAYARRPTLPQVQELLMGLRRPAGNMRLHQLADEIADMGFGRIPNALLARLLGVAPDDGQAVGDPSDTSEAAFMLALRLVEFIRRDLSIPRFELVPRANDLMPLAGFFRRFPEPAPRNRELLTRWFWRQAVSRDRNRPTRPGNTAAAGPVNEHAVVQRLLATLHPEPATDLLRFQFDLRFAESRLVVLALLDLEPRHVRTNDVIRAADLINAQARMRIPKCFRGYAGPLWETAANRLVHPDKGRLTRLLEGTRSAVILRSHAISDEAAQSLRGGDREQFLQLRAAEVARQLNAFLARRTRWGEPERPPLSALIID